MNLGLKDKVVLCMASAAGLGKGIATELAREGAKVMICTSEAFKDQLQLSLPRPGTMLWPEITEQLESMERMLMAGRYSVAEIMQNTTDAINELIADMRG